MAQWPGMTDFQAAAMRATNFCDPQLASGQVVRNRHGLPASWSGGCAIVYKIQAGNSFWAARAFQYETDYLSQYELISEAITRLPQQSQARRYFVDFKYQRQGINVPACAGSPLNPFPIVKMEWAKAVTLDKWVHDNLNNSRALISLAGQWKLMVYDLWGENLAHGDLQQGNVLVTEAGELKLIDYDGMYAPAMKANPGQILGHKSWIHPKKGAKDFGDKVDLFPGLVGYISLLALAADNSLWRYNNGQNLLFTERDLRDSNGSSVYSDLARLTRPLNGTRPVCELAEALARWSSDTTTATTLWEVLGDSDPRINVPRPGPVPAPQPPPPPPPQYLEIIIVSDPPGSVVRINDMSYGQTDDRTGELRVNVEPRPSVFKVERQGRDSISGTFDLRTVRAGTTLRFTLGSSGPAQALVIRTDPLGAEVRIAGQAYGYVPPGGLHIPVAHFTGRQRVDIVKDGYQKCVEFINFDSPSRTEYDFPLRRKAGSGTLGYWLLSNATALIMGLLCLNQFAGAVLFPQFWGVFAFFSAALAVGLNAIFPKMYRVSGGSPLTAAAILAVALGPPEILLNVGELRPALFNRQSLFLLFIARYAGFLPGILLGWFVAKGKWHRHLSFASAVLLIWGLGVVLPSAVLHFAFHGTGFAGSIIMGLLIGGLAGAVLSALPQESDPVCSSSKPALALVMAGLIGFILIGADFAFMPARPPALTVFTTPGEVTVYSERQKLVSDRQGHLSIPFSSPGRFTLTFKKEDFSPEYKTITITEHEMPPLNVHLRRTHTRVRLVTSVPTCEVQIAGQPPLMTDAKGLFTSPPLPVGQPLNIVIKKPLYEPAEIKMQKLPSGDLADLGVIRLQKRTGTVSIVDAPPGASIILNGTPCGKVNEVGRCECSGVLLGIPLTVRVEKPGWHSKHLKNVGILTENQPEATVHVSLTRKYVTLKLSTRPEDVKVTINREEKGRTGTDYSLLVPRVPLETVLRIQFDKEGWETATREVIVEDRGVRSGQIYPLERVILKGKPNPGGKEDENGSGGGIDRCFDHCDRMRGQPGKTENDIQVCHAGCYHRKYPPNEQTDSEQHTYDRCIIQCMSIQGNNEFTRQLYDKCCQKCVRKYKR